MNKTIKVNLGGFVFQLDEDAYVLLKAFLSKLEQQFENTTAGSEIVEDIESRIAELLMASLVEGREVVSLSDVEEVLLIMGDPESYANDEGENEVPISKGRGKLHREPNNMVIGGVASGISVYLGINPVWVRLFLSLSIFAYSIGFWVYLLLWLVLPLRKVALSSAEQRDDSPFVMMLNNVFSLIGKMVRIVLRLFTILLGLVLVLVGFPFLVVLLGVSLFPVFDWGRWGIFSPSEVFDFLHFGIVQDGTALVIVLLLIVAIIPVVMATYLGVRLLFLIKVKDGWVHAVSFFVWLAAAILLGVITALNVSTYAEHEWSNERVELSVAPDTLRLMMDTPMDLKYYDKSIHMPDTDFDFYYNELEKESCGLVTFNLRQSNDSLLYMRIEKDVLGSSRSDVYHKLNKVEYNYIYKNECLTLNEWYKSSYEGVAWFWADVEIELYVPRQTVLVIDERVMRLREARRFLHELENEIIYVDMD